MDFAPILRDIKPTKKEEQQLNKTVQQIVSKIKVKDAVPMLGGSGAKKTWLKNTHDIDIYVKFKHSIYKDKSGEIADILHQALKKRFQGISRLHGSRDYFQLKHRDYTIEIVPILDISQAQQAKNTTDFSKLHVDYVLKEIRKNKKLSDEIRLVKQFAKANHVYGAESYIRGFSGYVLELLTSYYGSFTSLMKVAAKWKPITVIGSKTAANKLNPAKRAPLIVIDPVQPDRNAAAALSEEKFYDLIMAARTFLKHQSPSLFREKHLDPAQLSKLGKLIQLEVTPLSGNRDIVGAKLLKAFTFIREQVKHYDFSLVTAKWSFNPIKKKSVFYFVVDRHELPSTRKLAGPPADNQKAVENFKKAHKDVVIKQGRAYALKKRDYTTIDALIKDVIKIPNVASRVKRITVSVRKK